MSRDYVPDPNETNAEFLDTRTPEERDEDFNKARKKLDDAVRSVLNGGRSGN